MDDRATIDERKGLKTTPESSEGCYSRRSGNQARTCWATHVAKSGLETKNAVKGTASTYTPRTSPRSKEFGGREQTAV
jgi:hypothetical protein